ncbi:MAG: hypothetical protein QXS02_02530 [Candidatus Thermoplasmatota archaeon]
MKRINMGLIFILILLVTILNTGCITDSNQDKNKDVFYSDVVDLVNHSLKLEKNKQDKIVKATVTGRISNKLDRIINVNITVMFYSKTDEYLDRKSYEIYGLREKGELGSATNFEIVYTGNNVSYVDYIKMHAFEIT